MPGDAVLGVTISLRLCGIKWNRCIIKIGI